MCRSREEAQAELGAPENGLNPTARDIASMNDGDGHVVHEVFDREKTLEWILEGLARIAAMRAERMRELTGESRREAQAAKAARRSRRDWRQNDKTTDRPAKRAARAKPATTGINAAGRVDGVSPRDPVRAWRPGGSKRDPSHPRLLGADPSGRPRACLVEAGSPGRRQCSFTSTRNRWRA